MIEASKTLSPEQYRATKKGTRGNYRHGYATKSEYHGEYTAWVQIRQRCNNPKNGAFSNYGGRGIKVCARWESSFELFLKDMGQSLRPNIR